MTLYEAWVKRHRHVIWNGFLCRLVITGPWMFFRTPYREYAKASWNDPVELPPKRWRGWRSIYR